MAKLCLRKDSMFAYCLFCETLKCKKIARTLEEQGFLSAFAPSIVRRQRLQGKNIDVKYDLFPGYVIAYSNYEVIDWNPIIKVDGVIRRLGASSRNYKLEGTDYEFAIKLFEKEGTIGVVKVYRVGDRIELDDPLFMGCKGIISKIDFRKQRARVEFRFSEMNCYTWIACDIIKDQD